MGTVEVTERWSGPGRSDAVITPPAWDENGAHPSDRKRAFEHWYFDARLDDGHVVVGFLQLGRPDTPKAGVEIHVYRPDGTRMEIRKVYPDAAVSASPDHVDVRIGHNTGKVNIPENGGLPSYDFFLDEDGVKLDLNLQSELPPWQPGEGKSVYGDKGFFAWVVGAPRARVTGTIELGDGEQRKVTGVGYHDHNWGAGDMRRIIDHWYWGRLYADDFTLIYAHVNTRDKFLDEKSAPLMLAHEDRIVLSTGEIRVERGPGVYNPIARNEYPSTLRLVGDEVDVKFDVQEVIHAHDLLSDVPVVGARPLRPLINRLVGQPGYFRFRSTYTLEAKVDGQDFTRTGETLHEMVRLS